MFYCFLREFHYFECWWMGWEAYSERCCGGQRFEDVCSLYFPWWEVLATTNGLLLNIFISWISGNAFCIVLLETGLKGCEYGTRDRLSAGCRTGHVLGGFDWWGMSFWITSVLLAAGEPSQLYDDGQRTILLTLDIVILEVRCYKAEIKQGKEETLMHL